MLICLPLQGLASVTMASCQMRSSTLEMHMDETHGATTHCNMHKTNHEHTSHLCVKCTCCYLSATQAIVTLNIPIHLDSIAPMFTSLTKEFSEPVPTSFFHPPRFTFA